MPVPKRKHSRQRIRTRWANKHIIPATFAACSNCQATVTPHTVCQECGYFKGRQVLVTKSERSVKRMELRKKTETPAQDNPAQQA